MVASSQDRRSQPLSYSYPFTMASKTHIQSRKHSIATRPPSSASSLLVCATALASFGLSAAQAQTAETTLHEVKVEAVQESGYEPVKKLASPKYTAPLAETTQTIQVINEQVIKDQGATTLTEAMRNVPGAGTFDAGEGRGGAIPGDGLYMRGFDVSNSIYIDGVRDIGTISRDVFNTEQIEVTQGAAGTDYGRTSPAGSINLVTKQPKLQNSFDGSLGLGSGKYKRATVDINRKIDDTSAVRLNLLGQDAGVAGRDQVKNDRWGIAGAYAWGLGTATRINLDLVHIKQNNTPESGVSLVGFPGWGGTSAYLSSAAKADTSNWYGTTDAHDDVSVTMATARIEHDISSDTTLRNTLRWGRNKQDALILATAGVTGSATTDPSTWTVSRLATFRNVENEILTNQTNLSTKFNTGSVAHSLSTGLELTREKQTGYGSVVMNTAAVPTTSLYNPGLVASGIDTSGVDKEYSTDTAALYAFDTVKLSDKLQLNGGLRYEHYKIKYANPAASTVKLSDSMLTYKIGALYKLSSEGNVYANYATSKLPPGATSGLLGTNAITADDKASKSKMFEIGTKWELLNKNLLLTGAVFQGENNVPVADDDGLYYGVKKRVSGYSVSATGQITKDWSAIAAFTHQNTKATEVSSGNDSGLGYTPKNALSLWTTYRTPVGLTVGGGMRYSDGFRIKNAYADRPSETSSYVVFDALLTYQVNKNWDLQLNVYNLFNRKYVTAINRMAQRYTPGLERSARITANFHF